MIILFSLSIDLKKKEKKKPLNLTVKQKYKDFPKVSQDFVGNKKKERVARK